MSGDSYSSLLNHAIYVMDKIKLDKNIMMLVEAIKYEYRHEGKWSPDLLKKHDKLKKEMKENLIFYITMMFLLVLKNSVIKRSWSLLVI